MGVGVLLSALWLIFDSELYPFAFRDYYIDGTMSFFMMLLMPFPFLYYMNHMQRSRYRQVYLVVALLLEGVFVVSSVIHFSGASNFLSMFPLLAVAMGAAIVGSLTTLILDVQKNLMHTYGISFVGLMGFVICCVLELILILLVEDRYDGSMIIVGLYWMVTMAIVHQLYMVREAQAEAAMAQRASETKSNFLANMSHEIRTPMNAILGMDEMILREAANNDKIKKYASDIKSAGNLLLSIINDILDISKIESGKAELILVEFDICSVINDLLNIAEKRAFEKDLLFLFEADRNIPLRFRGDEIRIRQILLNIINNAIKYTEKGEVRVRMQGRRDPQDSNRFLMQVAVKDTGIGIKKEDQVKLFQPFDRLEQTKNRNVEGTGLGLHIANEYVQLMGGRIDLDSVYGEGSVFTISIPLTIVDDTPLEDYTVRLKQIKSEPEEFRASVIAPAARALVVDDNEMNLEVISGLLQTTKMKVDVALSGPEGIRMMEAGRYDIVFLDQMMPGMDGITTLKEMKTRTVMRGVSAVALTADAVVGSKEYYLSNGFDDYLSKPVRIEELEEVLRRNLPAGMILSQADVDRINRAEESRKVNRENLRSVLVVDADSERLKDVKARMDGTFKGTFVTGQDKAEKYLQKHDADYVMLSYREYMALLGEDK
jgi:signal transduction histidine kinase/DNA-binding NarL/FixJ family response regulator